MVQVIGYETFGGGNGGSCGGNGGSGGGGGSGRQHGSSSAYRGSSSYGAGNGSSISYGQIAGGLGRQWLGWDERDAGRVAGRRDDMSLGPERYVI